MRSLKEIDARIAELEVSLKAELSIEERISKTIAEYHAKRIKESPPESPPAELSKRIMEATEVLQLQPAEIKLLWNGIRVDRLINPCAIPAHSPTYRCAYHAASCNHLVSKTGTASGSCTCTTTGYPDEMNPKGSAYGYGSQGWSQATVYSWCWFEITPAYPDATFVTVNPKVVVHGFYVLNSGTIPPSVKLELLARGYQYDNYSWGEKREIVLNETGDKMGRFDATKYLNFQMPVGADPFFVLVMAILRMEAKGAGSSAVGDFATGNGNRIEIRYVNTWD